MASASISHLHPMKILPASSHMNIHAGTGRAQSFNAMAAAVVNAIEGRSGGARRDVEELVEAGAIQYVPMPSALAGKYQSFTEADLTALHKAGYTAPFASVEEGAARYVERLMAAG